MNFVKGVINCQSFFNLQIVDPILHLTSNTLFFLSFTKRLYHRILNAKTLYTP